MYSPNLSKSDCISDVARICSIITFHLSKLGKVKFSILCNVIFLVRLQGNFDIDHSWEWKGLTWLRQSLPQGRRGTVPGWVQQHQSWNNLCYRVVLFDRTDMNLCVRYLWYCWIILDLDDGKIPVRWCSCVCFLIKILQVLSLSKVSKVSTPSFLKGPLVSKKSHHNLGQGEKSPDFEDLHS